eukprot:6124295-Prymnesium_polylepis.1
MSDEWCVMSDERCVVRDECRWWGATAARGGGGAASQRGAISPRGWSARWSARRADPASRFRRPPPTRPVRSAAHRGSPAWRTSAPAARVAALCTAWTTPRPPRTAVAQGSEHRLSDSAGVGKGEVGLQEEPADRGGGSGVPTADSVCVARAAQA